MDALSDPLAALLHYQSDYLDSSAALFAQLRDGVDWQQPELMIFGRRCKTPRQVAFVGDPGLSYRYSGHRHDAAPWPGGLLSLRQRLVEDFGYAFNCALLNYYRNGDDSMGYHSDDEAELGPDPALASISLGASRELLFRPRRGATRSAEKLRLADGSLLLMLPGLQKAWQHALPRRRGQIAPRINITFRKVC